MTEQWTYAGRRTSSSGKLVAAYVTEDGRLSAWPLKKANRVIGSVYTVENVVRDASGDPVKAAISSARFSRSGDTATDTLQEWTVEDRSAYAENELRALEARAKRDSDVWAEMTLAELRGYFQKLPVGRRAAMQAWITTYLQR